MHFSRENTGVFAGEQVKTALTSNTPGRIYCFRFLCHPWCPQPYPDVPPRGGVKKGDLRNPFAVSLIAVFELITLSVAIPAIIFVVIYILFTAVSIVAIAVSPPFIA